MQEELVGYVLDALEPEARGRVEVYLREHPEANHHLDLLRRALAPLASDKEEIEPTPGLVHRTIGRVAEYRCRPLPAATPPPLPRAAPPADRRWMRRDVVVAAALLLFVGGFGTVGLVQLRQMNERYACQNTLAGFHQALSTYSDQHNGDFPMIGGPPETRTHIAGAVVPMLLADGALTRESPLRCSGATANKSGFPTEEELSRMTDAEFKRAAPTLSGSYAYTLGYRDPNDNDNLCGLHRNSAYATLNNDSLPIMADKPKVLASNQRGNSPNHGGQNVLTVGGNVNFFRTVNAGLESDDNSHKRDDIYTNRTGAVAAGLDWADTVLGFGADKPMELPPPR